MYKITDIIYTKSNKPGTQITEGATMTGEHNIIIPAFDSLKKRLDRDKIAYIFKFENLKSGTCDYHYALTRQEIENVKKLIPNL